MYMNGDDIPIICVKKKSAADRMWPLCGGVLLLKKIYQPKKKTKFR